MKYKAEIEIDLPKEKLIELYSKDILKWYHSIKEHVLIDGENGKVNAKYHVKMEQNGQLIEYDYTIVKVVNGNEWWIESIKENDFKTFKKLSFLEMGPNKTRIVEEYEIELTAFIRDINKNLNALKEFAENKT